MQPQPPEKKQLRKQDFSSNCYFTRGVPSRNGTLFRTTDSDMPTANRRVQTGFWEAKDDAVGCNVRRITQEAHNGRGVIGSRSHLSLHLDQFRLCGCYDSLPKNMHQVSLIVVYHCGLHHIGAAFDVF